MSDSVRPHRRQPTRLPCPWDSPGKNTGAGCHFLLQCMKSESEVAQSFPTLSNPMDCSTPGFPVLHQLLELAQTHVHRVSDAIQPSHPLSSPSPPAFNLSQHQGGASGKEPDCQCRRHKRRGFDPWIWKIP